MFECFPGVSWTLCISIEPEIMQAKLLFCEQIALKYENILIIYPI